jgi:hypothetical protein
VASVATAATVIGDNGPNVITGTFDRDRILVRGGADTVNALAGRDRAPMTTPWARVAAPIGFSARKATTC